MSIADRQVTLEDVFKDELLKGEKLLWTDKPNPAVIFTPFDIFLVPFSIVWCGFVLFWEAMVLREFFLRGDATLAPFLIVGLLFVVVGLFFLLGRFIYKRWRRRRTSYAVTDQRVIVITDTRSRNVEAAYIRDIPAISRTVRADGSGTITFGSQLQWFDNLYADTGLDLFGTTSRARALAFRDIRDVRRVHDLVNGLRSQQRGRAHGQHPAEVPLANPP